jgi:MerR HTH family regulatory protein
MGEILKKPLPSSEGELYTFETRGSTADKDEETMAPSRQVDLLEPIDLAEHLGKVDLYLGQVCQIAGISKMQLDYWTNKAQIPTKGKKQRIYDIDALETVMLIKQAKDKGLNLGAAIDAARRFREVQTNEPPAVPQQQN